ncbi:unnamed protein product [Rotaria sp. Silwood1]|nr:unnamed protein product [Rotaria sp. Silwood1]
MTNKALIWIKQRWRLVTLILIPLVLLPLPIIIKKSQARCGYIVLILALYWIFEVIPLPVTSLLPLILFPMAGVLEANKVAPLYFQDIIALFFGSLAFAHAIELVNLHRRIALFVLRHVGTSTKWTLGGLMAVTAFLSMWINNSAAASIMLPVSLAIIDELERHEKNYSDKKQTVKEATSTVNEVLEITETEVQNGGISKEVILDASQIEESNTEVPVEVKQRFRLPWQKQGQLKVEKTHEKKYEELRKCFLLATAYSATIGGLASLVGTGPNVFVKGFIDSLFKCRTDPEDREALADLKAMLIKQYNDLGKPNWSEYTIGIIFIIMIILWVTREFGETHGWDIIFEKGFISDSTVAVFCGLLPLILPNSNPFQSNWKYEPIVQWNTLVKNISWSAIFLLGAGLSVASAFTNSKLSESVAQALRFLHRVPHTAVIMLVIVISGLFTEVTSNLSTASIFLPVLDSVSRSSFIHPAYLILPCTLAVSLAFMLPIGDGNILKLILNYFPYASLDGISSSNQSHGYLLHDEPRHLIQRELEAYENEIPLACIIRNDRSDLLSILFQFKSFTFDYLSQQQKQHIFNLCLLAEHRQVSIDKYNIKWFKNQSLRPCGSIECFRLLIEYANFNPFYIFHDNISVISPFTLVLEPIYLYLIQLHNKLLIDLQIKFHTRLLRALYDLINKQMQLFTYLITHCCIEPTKTDFIRLNECDHYIDEIFHQTNEYLLVKRTMFNINNILLRIDKKTNDKCLSLKQICRFIFRNYIRNKQCVLIQIEKTFVNLSSSHKKLLIMKNILIFNDKQSTSSIIKTADLEGHAEKSKD